jgi:hypothetical protein
MVLLKVVSVSGSRPARSYWTASTGGHAMRDEPEIIPALVEGPPSGRVAVWGLKAASVMTVVWAVLILVAMAWLGVWVAKYLT